MSNTRSFGERFETTMVTLPFGFLNARMRPSAS